jgi:hypothetical protein
VIEWRCERGGAPRPGEAIYVATVELGRAAMPPGVVQRDVKPPAARVPTGKPRRSLRARAGAPERELWLPGDFPAALARQETIDRPATPSAAPRRPRADPDSIVEVWEAPR